MLPDQVLNPGPLTYESGALPIALRGPAGAKETHQLNHDRPDLRQPGMGVSHQPPVLLVSKV